MPIIALQGVGKTYPSQAGETEALRDVSLAVERGEFVSLIGPSGCGKSTLLRIVADLVPPSAGTVTVNGKSPGAARLDRDYGIVFQAPVLYDWRTVEATSACRSRWRARRGTSGTSGCGRSSGWSGSTASAATTRGSSPAGCSSASPSPGPSSANPAILLMDEPFGALDEMTRERLNGELLNVCHETGATALFVTHSIGEAVFLSTRVVVLSPRPGRIARVVDIDLPRPRSEKTRALPRFFELVTTVREHLVEDPALATAPVGPRGPAA